jgi:uncharacterized repeat protein (TIGR02543 family)
MNRKKIYAGTAAAFLLLFFINCEITGPEAGKVPADGKVAVRVSMEASGIRGRTVLPGLILTDVTAWELWGGITGNPETLLEDFFGNSATVYLEEGTWHFTLQGYKDDDLILEGAIPGQSITLEGPNTLAFTVSPVLTGNGTFKMTINLPAGYGITTAKVFQDGTQIDTLTPDADALVFEDDYAAGNYYFSFRLYNNSDLYGVVSETVQVRANLRSEKEYTLGREDLNLVYVINYHLNGGQLDAGVDNPDYYRSTDAAITLPIPARTGYTFGGWYGASDLSDSPVTGISQGGTEDRDFYAKWTANTYTVVYDKNAVDAIGDTPSSAHFYGISTALTANGFSRTGYTFTGWNEASDGTGTSYTGGQSVTNLTAANGDTVTLYAQWRNEVIVNISIWVNEDDGNILFSSTNNVTISKGSVGLLLNAFNAAVGSEYSSIQWYINGSPLSGTQGTARFITIRAADYLNGTYILGVQVIKNGIPYSTDIRFTVTS